MKIENIEDQIRKAELQARLEDATERIERILYAAAVIEQSRYRPTICMSYDVFRKIAYAAGGVTFKVEENFAQNYLCGYPIKLVPGEEVVIVGIDASGKETLR
jgi:ABC-type transport system involved in cytochrome bd biosynthesis fused ATPase/permease subunit